MDVMDFEEAVIHGLKYMSGKDLNKMHVKIINKNKKYVLNKIHVIIINKNSK